MALDLAPPIVPGLDDYGVLDLDLLQGRELRTELHMTPDALGLWVHPFWRGITRDGAIIDYRLPPRFVTGEHEIVFAQVANALLRQLEQGYAVYSYTVQPAQAYDPNYEESRRVVVLIGTRHFPGSGLNVASIKESHQLQFDDSDLSGRGATVAVAPWQAMHVGDRVTLVWQSFRENGAAIREERQVYEVEEGDVGLPVSFAIALSSVALARRGKGLLHYVIDYVGGEQTIAPTQTFIILPAPVDRNPPLTILEHGGGAIDPALLADGMTFSVPAYAQVHDGDTLIIHAEDVATGVTEFISGIRLDRSSVDSGRLQVRIEGDWLNDYLDRDLSLGYQIVRPGLGLAGEALVVPVRATMNLPLPVVDGASGTGQAEGEFKALATKDGIRIWVPSAAAYPATAQVQMHWQGFPGVGSYVATESNGARPPSFLIPPTVVAPNLDKTVEVFYQVTVADEAPRQSAVFRLKILPVPTYAYPTLQCQEAVNGQLRVASLPSLGSNQTVTPWPLIAVGQRITIAAAGTLKSGLTETTEFVKDQVVVNASSGISAYLSKAWLSGLATNSDLEFTVSVTADGGETRAIFPRVYVKIL